MMIRRFDEVIVIKSCTYHDSPLRRAQIWPAIVAGTRGKETTHPVGITSTGPLRRGHFEVPVSPHCLRSSWLIRLLEIGCNFGHILLRERSTKDLDHLVDDSRPESEAFAWRLSGNVVE